ncbi:MAG: nicotinate (nicotinamide) nucleotide adenylyltransferase [Balneolales bacterium]
MQRIGLFGGSFDPVHSGHRKMTTSFLNSGRIDRLWILPSASPPHKGHKDLAPYGLRCKMVEAAFLNWPDVKVVRIEEQLPAPNYTLHTVRRLKHDYPDARFLLCLGSDSLQQITSWYRYRELFGECRLLVAKRPGVHLISIPDEASVDFVDHEPVSISSSEVRSMIGRGEPVGDLLPPEVVKIIDAAGLYRRPAP